VRHQMATAVTGRTKRRMFTSEPPFNPAKPRLGADEGQAKTETRTNHESSENLTELCQILTWRGERLMKNR
jgi:hypothetical protein